jgi:hypothetical protein
MNYILKPSDNQRDDISHISDLLSEDKSREDTEDAREIP